jgi:hypothetical protein
VAVNITNLTEEEKAALDQQIRLDQLRENDNASTDFTDDSKAKTPKGQSKSVLSEV